MLRKLHCWLLGHLWYVNLHEFVHDPHCKMVCLRCKQVMTCNPWPRVR